MEKQIGPSFKKIKAAIYKKDSSSFYVYAKPNLCDTKTVTKYISRYLGRPVIALNRIDSYDGKNVTFHYHRHETMLLLKNVSLRWILFLCSSSTSRNITTKWSAIMVFMPDTRTMTKSSGVPFRKTDSPSFAVLQNGVITSLCPLDMILFAANCKTGMSSHLIFISITNGFLWKKCTEKDPWPN